MSNASVSSAGRIASFLTIRGGLIVSCQAPGGTPIDTPEFTAATASTVVGAGAVAVRAQGIADVAAISRVTDVPIIGLVKRHLATTPIHITPIVDDVAELELAGSSIVAVDATGRTRPNGLTLKDFVTQVRARSSVPLLADVDTAQAGIAAADLGFEAVATTLSGYTEQPAPVLPNIKLVEDLANKVDVPVIAEGGFSTPEHVRQAFEAGAWAVCVGTAITNPFLLTKSFVSVLN